MAEELERFDEALARRLRRGHRAEMQVGDIAHIDEAEAQARQAGHPAGQQALHDLDGVGKVAAEDRPQHHGGIDDRQSRNGGRAPGRASWGGLHQIPGGALGQGLGAGIGTHPGIVEIGPYRLVAGTLADAGPGTGPGTGP